MRFYQKAKCLALVVAMSMTLHGCDSKPSASSTQLQSIQGHSIQVPNEKYLVVNLWASWCSPCRQEIPHLNQINDELTQAKVIGINIDHLDEKTLSTLITQLNIEYDVLTQYPKDQLALPEYNGVPTTFILTPEGKWLKPLVGLQTAESIKARFEDLA